MSRSPALARRVRRADGDKAPVLAMPRGPVIRLAASPRSTSLPTQVILRRHAVPPAVQEALDAFVRALDARLPLVESDEAWWSALTPVYGALRAGLAADEAGRFEVEADVLLARRGCPGWAVREAMTAHAGV